MKESLGLEDLKAKLQESLSARRSEASNSQIAGIPSPIEKAVSCEICRDRGWFTPDVPIADPEFGEVLRCRCVDTTERMKTYSALPLELQGLTFETFGKGNSFDNKQTEQLGEFACLALEFAMGETVWKWLVLSGSLGWGKTHLAVAIIIAQIEHPEWGAPPGKYGFCPEILDELKDGFDDNTYHETMKIYQEAPLLLMDDLGSEYSKKGADGLSWADEQLFRILDHRYVRRMPTIITSNTNPDRMNARIRDRIMDTGSGLCRVLNASLPSYRTGKVVSP